MIQYNNTNEYNSIKSGDTVYISGLLGKNLTMLNNKHGIVQGIFLSNVGNRISYMAEIKLFSDDERHFVNFDYVFKVGKNLNRADIQSIIWENDPFNHYKNKKNLVSSHAMVDDIGQLFAICIDNENRKHVFLYSGIN